MSYRLHAAGAAQLWLGTTGQVAAVIGGEFAQNGEADRWAYHLVLDDPGNGEAWIAERVTPARLRAWAARLDALADELAAMITVTIGVRAVGSMEPAETRVYENVRIPAPPAARGRGSREYQDWASVSLIGPFLGDYRDPADYTITILAGDDPALIGHVVNGE